MAQQNRNIERNLVALNQRIDAACTAAGRTRDALQLIAVSKTMPIADVREAYALGLRHFGENYVDEAVAKIRAGTDLAATWHFIGRVQSNKTRSIATHFDWVHTIDRPRIAQRLNDQCPPGKQLNVLIQVNIDADPDKAGVMAADTEALLAKICELPNLRARGLMTILARPSHSDVTATTRESRGSAAAMSYRSMAQLAARLKTKIPSGSAAWDTLSMGMTADLEEAVAAGATHLRIGTALFGERQKP
ncbi:MAG: YggS family pyridoxal phosphate-dependent enzyme [Pseudomonadota bacterium]